MASSVLKASFEAAAGIIQSLCFTKTENEETLTGTVLGALATANAILSALSPPGGASAPKIYWGSYDKYQGKDKKLTEPGSGADFALLTLLDDKTSRLAIFQAKRGEYVDGAWRADLNRIPKDPDRDPQIFVLAETAARLFAVAHGQNHQPRTFSEVLGIYETTQCGALAGDLDKAPFVHYLVYQPQGPRCIALPHLGEVYAKELDRKAHVNAYKLPGKSELFLDVLRNGVGTSTDGWLVMDPASAIAELPNLLPLVPVIVTDSRGEFGPLMKLDQDKDLAETFAPLLLALGDQDLAQTIGAAKNGPGAAFAPERASRTSSLK
ncbi:hypothetical protein [Xanthomonas arboricola]|uniref:hypothetical protein n=1 Tax=Xanthomonas arboricola TaxID=56448 RepID=UPI0015CA0599